MRFVSRVLKFIDSRSSNLDNNPLKHQSAQLQAETLEPRMMLNGTTESIVFQADFEDVDVEKGGFAFFNEVSGLTASRGQVEVQDNHPSVGPAASGDQHLELDGINGVFVDLALTNNELRLQFEYSARPGADADLNAIQVYFEDQLLDTVSADGSKLKSTNFKLVEYALPTNDSNATSNIGRLEFRSNSPNDKVGLGGLLDNIVVFETLNDLELAAIADQEVSVGEQLTVSTDLLPPDNAIEGAVYTLVDGPVGATIDAATGEVTFVASETNVDASDARNDRTNIGEPKLVFRSGFEDVDVDAGGFDFFTELSGFTAAGRGIEVQDNHPSVGGASEGRQHIELDGNSRISRDVETVAGDQYELVLDFSARPGVNAADNAVDIFWDGQLFDSVTADGTGLTDTAFNEFRFDLSDFTGDLTTLALASRVPGSVAGLGGLVDNVRLYRRTVEEVDGPDGKYDVTVRVEVPDGRSDTESFRICIIEGMVDHPPELQPIADQNIDEQQPFSLTAQATDTDLPEDTLAYSIISGPDGLEIDAATGEVNWTPTESQGPGQYEVTVRVTDSTDLFDETTFNILVGEVGTPPVLEAIADQNVDELQPFAITALATDSDLPEENLTYSIASGPEGIEIDAETGEINWTPTEAQGPGQYEVSLRVTDSTDLFDETTFNILVGEVGTPPDLEPIGNRNIRTLQPLGIQLGASDSDLPVEELTFELVSAPEGMTIDAVNNRILWTPSEDQGAGEYAVEVQVTDSTGLFDRESFIVFVTNMDEAPTFVPVPNQIIALGDSLELAASASDPDLPDDTLAFDLISGPDGFEIDQVSGQMTWTPSVSQGIGDYDVEIEVIDSTGFSDQTSFKVTIQGESVVSISSQLAEDTAPGAMTNDDGVTSNPEIRGNATTSLATSNVVQLRASFTGENYVDISDALSFDSTFELPTETLAIINGAALSDGSYSLQLIATDSDGNDSNTAVVDFVLDTNAPLLELKLAEESDTGEQGDDITEFDSVTIQGTSEADAAVAFQNASTVEFTSSSGDVEFKSVAISNGENKLAFVSVDVAGNTTEVDYTVIGTVPESENRAPEFTTTPQRLFRLPNNLGETVGDVSPESLAISSDAPSNAMTTIQATIGNGASQQVDVFLLFDDTGSFSGTAPLLIDQFSNVVSQLQAELPNVDLGFGVGRFEDERDVFPFVLNQPIGTPDNALFQSALSQALDRTAPGNGGREFPETALEGLFQVATGAGFDGDGDGQTEGNGPAGSPLSQVVFNSFDTSAFGTFVSTETGIDFGYQIISADVAEQYQLGESVTGQLGTSGAVAAYRFNTEENQPLYLEQLAELQGVEFVIVNPDGTVLSSDVNLSNGDFKTDQAGEHLLLVRKTSRTSPLVIEFEFQIREAQTETLVGELDAINAGSISEAGDQTVFVFEIVEDTIAYFDSLTNQADLQWSLEGPSGNVVNQRRFTQSDSFGGNSVVKLIPGEYQLTVDGVGAHTGQFEFRMLDFASATEVESGEEINIADGAPNESRAFQIELEAGDGLFVDLPDASASRESLFRVIDPYGDIALQSRFLEDFELTNAAHSGTYTILVEGGIANPEPLAVQFRVFRNTRTVQPLELGQLISRSIQNPGQSDVYEFTVSDYSQIYFDSLTNQRFLTWSLSGPTGTLVSGRRFDRSDAFNGNGEISIPPGTYRLTIDTPAAVTNEYQFRVFDLNASESIEFGSTISDELPLGLQTNAYVFEASAGDQIQIEFPASSNPGNIYHRLLGPDGSAVYLGGGLTDSNPIDLEFSGKYTLLIEGWIGISEPETYTFNIALLGNTPPDALEGQELTLGEVTNQTISVAGEPDLFTFELAERTTVYFDALTDNVNLQWSLEGPRGVLVDNFSFNSSDSFGGLSVFSLVAGEYQLRVTDSAGVSSSYAFQLNALSNATNLTLGESVSADLPIPNETDIYRFDATVGQEFFIDFVESSDFRSTLYRVIDPLGQVVTQIGSLSDSGRFVTELDGPYTLLVEGWISNDGEDTYVFNLVDASPINPAFNIGDTVAGTIDTPGKSFVYEFELESSGSYYLDSLVAGRQTQFRLESQSRTEAFIALATADSIDRLSVYNLDAGSYRITVDNAGDAVGDFGFRFSSLADATSVSLGETISGELTVPNETDAYRFDAVAGERVFFDVISTTNVSAAWFSLFDSNGQRVFISNGLNDFDSIELDKTDTYTLLVEGRFRNEVAEEYVLQLNSVSPVVSDLTLGELVQGEIVNAGESTEFRFTVIEEGPYYFDSLTNSFDLNWKIEGPRGDVGRETLFRFDSVVDLVAGDYKLIVGGSGDATGEFSFRLNSLSNSSSITPGESFNGQLSEPLQTDVYKFSVYTGESFFLDSIDVTELASGSYQLIAPDGSEFLSGFVGSDTDSVVLNQTGEWYLLVVGSPSNTVAANYQFNIVPIDVTTRRVELGEVVSGEIGSVGDVDNYTFEVEESGFYLIDTLTFPPELTWTLNGPGNENSTQAFVELRAGQHVLAVDGLNSFTGAYSFRIQRVSESTTVSPGSVVNGELTTPNETDVYQFEVVQGESYFLDSIENNGERTVNLTLIDPLGRQFNSESRIRGGDFRQPAGTWTLLVNERNENAPTDYRFELNAVDRAPVEYSLGDLIESRIEQAGDVDVFEFSLSESTNVYFDSLTNRADIDWNLVQNGRQLLFGGRSFDATDALLTSGALNLAPGEYSLLISASRDATGDYSFRLSDLRDAESIAYDVAVENELTSPRETDLLQFNATAGDEVIVQFDGVESSVSGIWKLIDSTGKTVATGASLTNSPATTLRLGGDYTLLVEGAIQNTEPTAYTVSVLLTGNTPAEPIIGQAIEFNTTITQFSPPGARDVYFFELDEATTIYVDVRFGIFRGDVTWSIGNRDGQVARGDLGGNSQEQEGIRLAAGEYELRVDNPEFFGVSGPYSFRLLDFASATEISVSEPITNSRTLVTEADLYQFQAQAGERYLVDITSEETPPTWRIVDPAGVTVQANDRGRTFSIPVELPVSGQYTIIVEGGIGNEVPYEVTLYPVTVREESLVFGTATASQIDSAGETVEYEFDIDEPTSVYFDSLSVSDSLVWSLDSPLESIVDQATFSQSDSENSLSVYELRPGKYRLTVEGVGAQTGEVAFRVTPLAQAVPFVLGEIVSDELTNPIESKAFRFDAVAGANYYIDIRNVSDFEGAILRLVDPFGKIVAENSTLSDIDEVTLLEDGQHTLIIEGKIDAIEPLQFQLAVERISTSVEAIGSAVTGAVDPVGIRTARSKFVGEKGQVILFDGLIPESPDFKVNIVSPSGRSIYSNAQIYNDSPILVLPESGEYEVFINGTATQFLLDPIGNVGGVGFREGALPIILLATDTGTVYGTDDGDEVTGVNGVTVPIESLRQGGRAGVTGQEASFQETIDALTGLGALVVGLGTNEDPNVAPRLLLESIATLTGAVNNSDEAIESGIADDDIENGDPLYFTIATDSATSISNGIISAISNTLTAVQFDVDVQSSNPDVSIENLSGVATDVTAGDTVSFDVKIPSDGQSRSFDIQFVRAGTNVLVGSIPAVIQRPFEYDAGAVDPDGDTLTYAIVTGPTGASIDAETGLTSWLPPTTGSFEFEISADDGVGGVASQSFTVDVKIDDRNLNPVITSSPPRTILQGETLDYQVTANDANRDSLRYSILQAPEGVQIDAKTGALSWLTDSNVIGDQEFEIRVDDGFGGAATQRFSLYVNTAPSIVSAPPEAINLGSELNYQAAAIDLGGDQFTFELVNGPAGATITSTGLLSWLTTGLAVGDTNAFEIRVIDEFEASEVQTFTIEIAEPIVGAGLPTVTLTATDTLIDIGDTVNFQIAAMDQEGIDSLELFVNGVSTSINGVGTATATFDTPGVFTAIANATDTDGNVATQSLTIRVFDPADTEGPVVEIVSPTIESEVTYLADVVATILDENLEFYRVEFARTSDVDLTNLTADDADYQLIGSGDRNISEEVVATFDSTVLANDAYVIRVIAQDTNGRIEARGTIVNVAGNTKLGNFRLDFTDLSIPLAGIPIQINRSYDTLNANDLGTGGFGWNIGLADPDLRETIPDNGGTFFSQDGYKTGTRVYLNTPDGQRVGFAFAPIPTGSLLGTFWTPAFEAEAGVRWKLDVANNPGNALQQSADGTFGAFLGLGSYNPDQFVLTNEDGGTKYFYAQDLGLTDVEDTNGNKLTVTDDAITHSGGESIQFVRDAEGRITEIIDPDGNTINYAYDANGDLVSFTDQAGETTRFEYSDEIDHYLDRVIDPNGNVTASVKYDENGRFVALVDALGNELEQEFDLEENTFAQVDANGNPTTVKFDDRGNVVEETDALGNVTLYEYADDRNPTLETAITDRNGNTTRFKHDARGNTVLIEDENNQFTRFQYDSFNNVTQIIGPSDTDPGDGFADTLVDSFFQSGEVRGLTVREDLDDNNDARVLESADVILGAPFDPDTETGLDSDHISLDAGDFVTVAFDELVIDRPGDDLFIFTPRAFGNFTADGRTADVSVSTDGVNFVSVGQVGDKGVNAIDLADAGVSEEIQLVRITAGNLDDPQNISYVLTAIQASPADNPSTRFEYDSAGNLTLIENQLGDTASFTYDDFGRRLTFTDFNGNETGFEYTDSDGNPDVIRFADGAYQELEYNQFGQTTRESFFESDGTLVEQTQSIYDDAGRLLETIDGEGNRVVRTYDGNNLITETIVNPASVNEIVDTPIEDRLSRITQFEYDNAGRVVSQTDAEGGIVEFRYDGNGNRVLLQDPVGNITTWIYDSEDRIIEERDPLFNESLSIAEAIAALAIASGADVDANLGADHVRVFDYDAEGNQIERIDRNGRRIESTYDDSDRLLQEQWFSATGDLVDTVEFTYDAIGNQLTATDSDSSLSFDYDELNRLVSVSDAGTASAPTTILEYEYDAQGNVILTADNSGVTVESLYDVRNRLASKLWFDADGNEVDDARVDYLYNAAGRVSQMSRYSDLLATTLVGTTDRTYDLAGRSDILAHLGSAGELIASYDYDYDFGGLLIAEGRQHQLAEFTQSAQYSYDRTGQLLSAIYTGQPDEFFSYDANGNRESDSRPGSVYSTETGNRLTSDGLFDYEYDGEGNLVFKTKLTTDEDGQAGETTAYVYDHRNRLIEVTIKSEGGVILDEVSYAFDPLGRRIARTENGETIHFVYNGDNVWADSNESGEIAARYLFGNRIDENIARIRSGEGIAWHLGDRLGTIRDLIGFSGEFANHTELASFGTILSQVNETFADRYSFTGREYDEVTLDFYFRTRVFSSTQSSFISVDSIGFRSGDFNLYQALKNSLNVDPQGTSTLTQYGLTTGKTAVAFATFGAAASVGTTTFCELVYNQEDRVSGAALLNGAVRAFVVGLLLPGFSAKSVLSELALCVVKI